MKQWQTGKGEPYTPHILERPAADDLFEQLLEAENTYAIIDASSHEHVLDMLYLHSSNDVRCLIQGELEASQAAAAPFICRITPDIHAFIQYELWETQWGFCFTSEQSFDALRRHWMRWLEVAMPKPEGEGRENVLFRFFDRRVAEVFLTASTEVVRFSWTVFVDC